MQELTQRGQTRIRLVSVACYQLGNDLRAFRQFAMPTDARVGSSLAGAPKSAPQASLSGLRTDTIPHFPSFK